MLHISAQMLLLPTREDPLTYGFYDLIAAYTQDRQKFTLCVNSLDEGLSLHWNGSSLKTKVVSLLHSVETPVLSAVLCPRCPPCLVRVLSGVSSRLGVWVRGMAPSVALRFLLGNTASFWPSSGMWRREAARQGAGWPELFLVYRGKAVIPVFTCRIKNNLETVLTTITSEKEVHGSSPCLCVTLEEAKKNPSTQTCSL